MSSLFLLWIALGMLIEGVAVHRALRLGHVNDLLVRFGLLGQAHGWSEEKTRHLVGVVFVAGILFGVLLAWPYTAVRLAKALAEDDDLPGPWGHA